MFAAFRGSFVRRLPGFAAFRGSFVFLVGVAVNSAFLSRCNFRRRLPFCESVDLLVWPFSIVFFKKKFWSCFEEFVGGLAIQRCLDIEQKYTCTPTLYTCESSYMLACVLLFSLSLSAWMDGWTDRWNDGMTDRQAGKWTDR